MIYEMNVIGFDYLKQPLIEYQPNQGRLEAC